MKTPVSWIAVVALLGVGGWGASAQAFDSGSNGSYGAITVPNNTTTTLELPPDGILHCTTVTLGNNSTLQFTPNALNTPVFILAQGDVAVGFNSSITVSGASASGAIGGKGGPGGFDGGMGGFGPSAPANRGGDGYGPGRGINVEGKRFAAHANVEDSNTNVYGNALVMPLIGGSGGAGSNGNPGQGGGGGGGALLIASSTSIVLNGSIFASPGVGVGYGSGGSVRLIAPTGGGSGGIQTGTFGRGLGRIRIDTTNPLAFRNLSYSGRTTRGKQMTVFPPVASSLHFVEVAGQTIPVGAPAAVTVTLPVGAPLTQTVKLRAQGFTGEVPVRLVVTPEHSPSTEVDLVLNAAANPPELTTQITLTVGEPTRVEAWTR
ncbi:MAG: hypothetical protein J0M24_24820 [Verrucomicrobia bacterium]|nr:hypothetical protein [Verrucomicrobiota bacterium]